MKFLFDCDDTLYDLSWPFKMCLKEFQLPVPQEQIDSFYACYRAHGDAIFSKIQTNQITVDQSGAYRILKACEEYGIPFSEEDAVLFQQCYKHYQQKISMNPVFHAYFSSTESECGILTNGEDMHQRNKLRTLQVFSYIPANHIFTSGQIGVSKPDIRAFQYVMRALGEKPSDWVYIGDNYINDMEGAKKAGLHTIHFNRHHQKEGPCSDHVVYTEEELISLLRKLEGREKNGQILSEA